LHIILESVINGPHWLAVSAVRHYLPSATSSADATNQGKSAYYSRHPKWSLNWLMSVELVLLCVFHTISLMGNCSWLLAVLNTE